MGLRGQYFVCKAPPHLTVLHGEPEDFGNNEGDARNQAAQRPSFQEQYPSIGVLRDRHKERTQSVQVLS